MNSKDRTTRGMMRMICDEAMYQVCVREVPTSNDVLRGRINFRFEARCSFPIKVSRDCPTTICMTVT